MKFPTQDEVSKASHVRICEWYRHLPAAVNADERDTMDLIVCRFNERGGFTPRHQ